MNKCASCYRPPPPADLIRSLDQARDSTEDQRKRFALQELGGLSAGDHHRRLRDAVAALRAEVGPALDKGVWWRVHNGIRNSGTIRCASSLERGLGGRVGDSPRGRVCC